MADCQAQVNGGGENKPQNCFSKSKGQNSKSRSDKKAGNNSGNKATVQPVKGPVQATSASGAAVPPSAQHQLQTWKEDGDPGRTYGLHSPSGQYNVVAIGCSSNDVQTKTFESKPCCSKVEKKHCCSIVERR